MGNRLRSTAGPWTVVRQPVPVVKPADNIIIERPGDKDLAMSEHAAKALLHALSDVLGEALCTMKGDDKGSACCCKNCPWNGRAPWILAATRDEDNL